MTMTSAEGNDNTAAARFTPIADVDLDTYARLIAAVLIRGIRAEEMDCFTTAAGISPSRWALARAGWMARIREHEDVRDAYALSYRRAVLDVKDRTRVAS